MYGHNFTLRQLERICWKRWRVALVMGASEARCRTLLRRAQVMSRAVGMGR